MGEWKEHRLGDLAKINHRSIGRNYPFADILYLDTGSITKGKVEGYQSTTLSAAPSRAKRLVQDNDIVYSTVRPIQRHYGFVRDPNENLVVSTGFAVISTIPEKACPKYLYYFLTSDEIVNYLDVVADGSTSAYPSLTPDVIADLELSLPPLPEQKAIAEVLSSLDDKIDLLHRQNKTLESLAQTIFRQWFIEEAVEEWQDLHLGDFVETTLGGEWGKEIPEGDHQIEVQCIRGTDVADLQTGLPERAPIRFIKPKKFENIKMKDGDLVMEISGGSDDQSTGRTTYVNSDVMGLFHYPLVFSNFCRLIRPSRKEFSFFLYAFIQHLYKQGDLFNLENGTSGIRNLNYKSLLFELTYKIPGPEKILSFDKAVSGYFAKVNKNKQQVRTLKKLRDMLLPKLMSGEIQMEGT